MYKTMTKRLMLPVVAATALAASALAGCGGQTAATTADAAQTYTDGTYQGDSVSIRWGTVRVEAVVSDGKITSVEFLTYPTGDSRSQQINSQAAPTLTQEAVQAQSATVQAVSGATFTSEAFMQSLSTALEKAA
jgi:uncharacterized protein with FMN-binding domain